MEEKPKTGFLEKLKTNKFKILVGILGVLIFAGAVFGAYRLGQKQAQPGSQPTPTPGIVATPTPIQEVTIATDKTEYEQGEPIKITVRNGLDVPILHYGGGDRFWGIEYLEDGKWKNLAYERGGGFQLTEENINDACYIRLYERMPPIEMKVNSILSHQWNQRICPFGEEDPSKPTFVKYIGAGHYRLIFYYGFEISSEDPYKIKDRKTVYSNEFTIKEKKEIDCFQLNEEQCRNQLSCVPLGEAITTYFTEGEVETFSFKECVNRVPEYKNCKEVVKMTQMRGGSQYSKECRCCCGEGPFCKKRPYPEK